MPAMTETNGSATVATHTAAVGVILPPPDVRAVIDKTANFVAVHGREFEERIVAKEKGNAHKFSFLSASDPYRAYYDAKVEEVKAEREGGGEGAAAKENEAGEMEAPAPAKTEADAPSNADEPEAAAGGDVGSGGQLVLSTKASPLEPVPLAGPTSGPRLLPPEQSLYSVTGLMQGMEVFHADVMKLTAMYTARNGKAFLESIAERESSNPQFSFLAPSDSQHKTFTKLCDAYSKIMIPPAATRTRLESDSDALAPILARCYNRVEWDRKQATAKKASMEASERNRMEMASIDWPSFVIVETIDFEYEEEGGDELLNMLPGPMTLEEVLASSKVDVDADGTATGAGADGGAAAAVEMDEEERQMIAAAEAPMKIVKNWKRPEERAAAAGNSGGQASGTGAYTDADYVVSPITGEKVLLSQMAEHMRISLIDPRWKSQREAMFSKMRETTKANDDEIAKNMVFLARTRPDIFGSTEEEMKRKAAAGGDGAGGAANDGVTNAINREVTRMINMKNSSSDAAPAVFNAMGKRGREVEDEEEEVSLPTVAELQRQQQNSANVVRVAPMGTAAAAGARSMPPPPPADAPATQSVAAVESKPAGIFSRLPDPKNSRNNSSTGAKPLPPPPPPEPDVPVDDPMGIPPPPPPPEDAIPPPPPADEGDAEPTPKRQRVAHGEKEATDEGGAVDGELLDGAEFIRLNPGPVKIKVQAPSLSETKSSTGKASALYEKLTGQLLELELPSAAEKITELKKMIAKELGLPVSKQQLSAPELGFIKDTFTLAQYNIGSGAVLALSLRERGGKRK